MDVSAIWFEKMERVSVIRRVLINARYKDELFVCQRYDGSLVELSRSQIVLEEEYQWIVELSDILLTRRPSKNPKLFINTSLLIKHKVHYVPLLEMLLKKRKNAKRNVQLTIDSVLSIFDTSNK